MTYYIFGRQSQYKPSPFLHFLHLSENPPTSTHFISFPATMASECASGSHTRDTCAGKQSVQRYQPNELFSRLGFVAESSVDFMKFRNADATMRPYGADILSGGPGGRISSIRTLSS